MSAAELLAAQAETERMRLSREAVIVDLAACHEHLLRYTVLDEARHAQEILEALARIEGLLAHTATCPCTHCAHWRASQEAA